MIQFHWPWVFLLLPLPFLLRVSSGTGNKAVATPPALKQALDQLTDRQSQLFGVSKLLIWLGWFALLMALAQPWQPGDTVVQPVSGRAVALAIDVSGSMERQDFTLDGVQSDRLSVVKRAAQDFINKRRGDRLSLVLYGRDAFIASPLTFDLPALGSILNSAGIGMAGRSTAIGDALGLSIRTLQNDPASSKAIVLLSDGTNNAGSVEPESAAELAISLGIRVHTIAFGSQDTSRRGYQTAQSADLDEKTLESIAQIASGQFFRASTTADLQDVYTAIDQLEQTDVDAPPVILRQDLRQWPLFVALSALLIITFLQRFRP